MHRVQVLSLRIPASNLQFFAVNLINAYINVVGIILLTLIKAIIPDHDIKSRDELKLKPEPNTRVLIDPETPITKELDPNFIIVYNIAEYDVID